MGFLKRLKTVEEKVDAIMEAEKITFKKQPRYKCVKKDKGEMGFRLKK